MGATDECDGFFNALKSLQSGAQGLAATWDQTAVATSFPTRLCDQDGQPAVRA